jgi:2-octaprenyl-6-methoxyphenol hydroxylase
VTVVDARPARDRAEAGFDGRAYALAIASVRLLTAIGVWPGVADKAQPILEIKASDGRAGEGAAPFFLHFDAAEIEEGPMGHMLEDRHLYAAFLTRCRPPGITLLSGKPFRRKRLTPVRRDGDAGLGAQADGAAAGRLRRARLGRGGAGGDPADRLGLRPDRAGHGDPARADHQGIAQQFFMPSGPLAILPLKGGHHSSIVWSETDATAAAIQALPDAEYLEALRPRFGDFLGEISLAGDRFTYPLSLSLAERVSSPPAWRWWAMRRMACTRLPGRA